MEASSPWSPAFVGECTAYTNVFLKCWVSAFCTIMEMCFATFDGFQKLLAFQHVVPTSSSHMKSCNIYLLSFSVSCMSRTFLAIYGIYGPYKLRIQREQYVGNLVGLISQFFCMELRGPRRSLTGQETPPQSWREPLQNLAGTLPEASAPYPELSIQPSCAAEPFPDPRGTPYKPARTFAECGRKLSTTLGWNPISIAFCC